MNHPLHRLASLILLIATLLSACNGAVSPTPPPTIAATSSASPTAPPNPTATRTIIPTRTPTAAPSPLPSATALPPITGATYHVALSGDDANPGTADAPFRTIQRCADTAQPGDECAIHAGVYRETVTLPRSGADGAPIRFRSFNGEDVTISGTDVVTGWVRLDENVVQAPLGWTLGPGRDQAFVDGNPFVAARHPNVTGDNWQFPVEGLNPLWPTRASGDANPDISDPADYYHIVSSAWDGFANDDLVGGIYVGWHYWGWSAQTGVISASVPGGIYVNPASVSTNWWCYHTMCYTDYWPDNGRGYVTGLEKLLDAPGEFFLDPAAQTIKLWLPGGEEPPPSVEVKRRQLAFDLRQRSYIQLVGLKVFAASLTMDGGAYNVIDACQFEYISHYTLIDDGRNGWIDGNSSFLNNGEGGLYIGGHDNAVQNSVIRYSAGAGLVLQGYRHLIHNNLIQECDYGASYLSSIFITWDPALDDKRRDYRGAHRITYNTLREAGRSLLHVSSIGEGLTLEQVTFYDSLVIEHNHILNGNLLNRDSGIVYGFGVTLGSQDNPGSFGYNVVHDNWEVELENGLVYWDNGTWYINNHHNLLWADPRAAQKDHSFNTGGEGREWAKDNVWLPWHKGGEAAIEESNFPGGQRFAYGHNFDQPVIAQAVPQPTPTPVNPDVQLEAEAAAESNGVVVEEGYVSQCDAGDWLAFKDVYLAENYSGLSVRILAPSSNIGQRVEVHLDAVDGPKAGEIVTGVPAEALTFSVESASLTGAGGRRDVYFVCAGEGRVGTIDWFRFTGGSGPTPTPIPRRVSLALDKPAQASALQETYLIAENAVDGYLDTRWGSPFEDPQWLMVDLGETLEIDRVVIYWEYAFGRDYTIQVSDDPAGPWQDVRSVTDSDGDVDELNDLAARGRYVRIYGTKRGTEYGYSIWELEIYGPAK